MPVLLLNNPKLPLSSLKAGLRLVELRGPAAETRLQRFAPEATATALAALGGRALLVRTPHGEYLLDPADLSRATGIAVPRLYQAKIDMSTLIRRDQSTLANQGLGPEWLTDDEHNREILHDLWRTRERHDHITQIERRLSGALPDEAGGLVRLIVLQLRAMGLDSLTNVELSACTTADAVYQAVRELRDVTETPTIREALLASGRITVDHLNALGDTEAMFKASLVEESLDHYRDDRVELLVLRGLNLRSLGYASMVARSALPEELGTDYTLGSLLRIARAEAPAPTPAGPVADAPRPGTTAGGASPGTPRVGEGQTGAVGGTGATAGGTGAAGTGAAGTGAAGGTGAMAGGTGAAGTGATGGTGATAGTGTGTPRGTGTGAAAGAGTGATLPRQGGGAIRGSLPGSVTATGAGVGQPGGTAPGSWTTAGPPGGTAPGTWTTAGQPGGTAPGSWTTAGQPGGTAPGSWTTAGQPGGTGPGTWTTAGQPGGTGPGTWTTAGQPGGTSSTWTGAGQPGGPAAGAKPDGLATPAHIPVGTVVTIVAGHGGPDLAAVMQADGSVRWVPLTPPVQPPATDATAATPAPEPPARPKKARTETARARQQRR